MMFLGGALLLLVGVSPLPSGDRSGSKPVYAHLTLRERVILRVPTRPVGALPRPVEWRERKGPRCVPLRGIMAAAITYDDSVDLVLRGGMRVRAKLESACPALDFYSGFYLRPTPDRQICADRDSIHARSGGECRISRFRSLTPKPPKRAFP